MERVEAVNPPLLAPAELSAFAVALIAKGSELRSLAGVSEIVRLFVEEFGAHGGVLWQIAVGNSDLKDRQLIAAAQYFRGEKDVFWRQIGMNRWTGQQILSSDAPRLVGPEEIEEQAASAQDDPDFQVLSQLGIRSFVVIPIYRKGNPWGSLNLYGREGELQECIAGSSAHAFAKLIPQLVEDIARRTGLELLTAIRNELRGRASHGTAGGRRDQLQKIVEMIAQTLGALEVSVYLESHAGGESKLQLEAARWPWPDEHKQNSYKPGDGITGYCFAEKKAVRIPDLARLQDHDQDEVEKKYPGITPQIRFDVHEVAKGLLPRSYDGRVPPVSWLGAPLLDEHPLGVLRVCGLKAGPYYFTSLHEELLVLVADQIAEWIAEQNRFDHVKKENAWLRQLVKGVAGLNHKVHLGLTSERFQRHQILTDALAVANEAIPDADSFSIRLAEDDNKVLRWAATLGKAWEAGSKQDIDKRKKMFFPLRGEKADNLGAQVFKTNKVVNKPDIWRLPDRCAPFPETRSLIIAPVASGQKVFGTLEARSNSPNHFSEQSVQVTELLGRQTGLYLFLAEKLAEARSARANLSDSLEQQRETFENLVHQLKTPVFLSVRRSARLFGMAQKRGADFAPDVAALRAICKRSEQVVTNIGLFADLARGAAIGVHPITLVRPGLIAQLKETVSDHTLLLNRNDGISFAIDEDSFVPLDQVIVQVDPRLLDQMLGNLLDNAAKYTFPNSQVVIRGGLTRQQQFFFIAVSNRGVPIAPEEAKRLAERGTRMDRALSKQGSGLGLYLVQEMLHAHKGVLEIQPTNSNGVTEVRLLLPCLGKEL
jgi:signal transduction histidine kinase